MKRVEELTEQEIRMLTDEDVAVLIKFKNAEEGIKVLEEPKMPSYFKIAEKDVEVYTCGLFGEKIAFSSIDELNSVLLLMKDIKIMSVKYDYNRAGSEYKYASSKIDKDYGYSSVFEIKSMNVYSHGLYSDVCDMIMQNKKMKEEYEKLLQEYNDALNDSRWISEEVWDKVSAVRSKYAKLDRYVYLFVNEYLALAGGDTKVAMNFLHKAYMLSEEEQQYVLDNYKND